MATSTVPLALAIMAHQQTRQANAAGAGLAVFTQDLSSLLWVNTPGAAFFGVDAPGPRTVGDSASGSPAIRQLRAAARMLAAGAAVTKLRGPGGTLVEATVTRLDLDGHGALALVAVPAFAAPSETPEARARRFHAEAGIAQAQIHTRDGARFFDAAGIDVDDVTVAAFLATDEPWQFREDGGRLVLARLGEEHALTYRPAVAETAPDEGADAGLASGAPATETASEGPRRTGMSAILTRWYARHPDSEPRQTDAPDGDGARETSAITTADVAAEETESAFDPATPIEAPANGEPAIPRKAPPLRSDWGLQATFAEPEAVAISHPDAGTVAADMETPTDTTAASGAAAESPADVPIDAEPEMRQATEADFPELPVNDDSSVADAACLPEEAADNDAPTEEQVPDEMEAGGFEPRFDIASVRFVWRIDSEGRFRSLSPEFAAAVGPHSADVIDRSFADVSRAYGLDPDGEVSRLLERRDTWSGRVVHWPIENSDRKAPVDLAALPVYARDRSFDGFRGFGVVRLAETVADPERLGFALAGVLPGDGGAAEPDAAAGPADLAASAPDDVVPFGRRAAPAQRQDGEAAPKVIRLEERRRPRDGALSQAEEEAFRRIGQTLSDDEPRGLEQAVRMAAQRIEGFGDAQSVAREPAEGARPEGDTATHDAVLMPAEGDEPDAAEEAAHLAESDRLLLDALATVYAHLPLPVLVQVRESLAYGNREFLDLTGYAGIEALAAEGGLAHLFADRDDQDAAAGELTIRRVTGETVAVRTHMQRSTIAGRSCLVMSFFASPGASVAAMLGRTETEEPGPDEEVRRLRHEVEELSTVLDTATDGVVFIDSAGNIRSMNGSAHALFGIAEDDSAGRPFVTLFAHESQKATMEYLESLRDGGASAIVNEGREVIGRVAQGGFIPLSITLGPLPDDRGWCAVIRDIAHWKRVEEELTTARRQAEAASVQKSQFLTNVSHELRTPLNAIIGFADVMATECFGPIGNDRYLEYLEDIKRSGHHVLDLVNDLLDISKIEAGKLDLSFEAVSLNAVMAEVVALMQPQANRERVLVRSNLPSSVPPVVADHRSIRQIAMNLVSNAIRFTPPGGQIIVSTSYVADGDVALRFRDSGIGMSEHEIEIAMLPFQQVNPTSRRRGEGTGLGLPLTKAMVEANRANFAISSTPGEGTLVEILFPRQRVLAD